MLWNFELAGVNIMTPLDMVIDGFIEPTHYAPSHECYAVVFGVHRWKAACDKIHDWKGIFCFTLNANMSRLEVVLKTPTDEQNIGIGDFVETMKNFQYKMPAIYDND